MPMSLSPAVKASVARALRNHQYERTPGGIEIPKQGMRIGGVLSHRVDDGPWIAGDNTMTLQFLDALLSAYLDAQAVPAGLYVALFTNNVAPTSALTAATFPGTQGEYTGYTQTLRPQWVPNGPSSGQMVSNSVAPAQFTVGSTATAVAGAAILTSSTKGATNGVLVAAALFGANNTYNPGSTISVQYSLSASPAP